MKHEKYDDRNFRVFLIHTAKAMSCRKEYF